GLLVPMNRRMPNGTYGGVVRTAGEIITRLLPDFFRRAEESVAGTAP
ncbi:MAG: hypothetical protein FD189_2477, partial [Elusimicrobia bacterium]